VDKEQVQQLITKYKKGLCNEHEIQLLNQWLDDLGMDMPDYVFDNDAHEDVLKEDIRYQLKNSLFPEKSNKNQLQFWIKIAAVLLLAGTIGIWSLNNHGHKQPVQYTAVYNPAGQLKTVILPDGSKVFLNAATKISFPTQFGSVNREVTLTGEAYFEVVHNPDKPFLIYTGKVKTQVLGTSFNVKAYANEPKITVAVVSGKVGVMAGKLSVLLTPNQKADYNANDGALLKGTIADASALKAWTDGQLVFRGQAFNEITRTLIRRYNTNIIIQNNHIAEAILNARFDKNESLENVISVLCTYVGARYKHEGTTYLIR
jgi:ferric-dicitrate binding protein FerR (iron transport regulator)